MDESGKGGAEEERMQHGNHAAGAAAASFIWLEILRDGQASGASPPSTDEG